MDKSGETKSKRGGLRPNSGRSKRSSTRTRRTFTLTQEEHQWKALDEQVERLNQIRDKRVTLNGLITEIVGREANRLHFKASE